MQLELRVLRYVVAVADEGGFQRAACRLHLAQPALSRQIRDLERMLEVRLFERRPTRLTPPGEIFVESARKLLADADGMVELVRQAAGVRAIRLGYTAAAAFDTLPKLLSAVGRRNPDLRIDAREGWPADLGESLRAGRLDLVLSFGIGGGPASGILRMVVRSEPLVVVVAASHRLAMRRDVRLRDLSGETLCLFARELAPDLYDRLVDAVSVTGESFEVWEHPVPGLRVSPLRGEEGFSIVPRSVIEHLPVGIAAVSLADSLPSIELELFWRADTVSVAAPALLSTVRRTALARRWITPEIGGALRAS